MAHCDTYSEYLTVVHIVSMQEWLAVVHNIINDSMQEWLIVIHIVSMLVQGMYHNGPFLHANCMHYNEPFLHANYTYHRLKRRFVVMNSSNIQVSGNTPLHTWYSQIFGKKLAAER